MNKPTNRREMFLHAIATGCECPVEPVTREEMLMAEHAKREAQGGGSSASNILILTVKSIDEETGTITMSHTSHEVYEAMNKNMVVLFSLMGQVLFTPCGEGGEGDSPNIEFCAITPSHAGMTGALLGDGTFEMVMPG